MTDAADTAVLNDAGDGGDQAVQQENAQPGAQEGAQAQQTQQQAQEPIRQTVVPYAALHEERQRRKELQGEVEKLKQRFEPVLQVIQKQQRPDIAHDPVGHFQHETQELRQLVQQHGETIQQFNTRQTQEAEQSRFDASYRASAQQFAASKPDFGDAYGHFIQAQQNALMQRGVDPAEMPLHLAAAERQIAQTAFMLGVNPGQLIYNTAASLGYVPKQAQQQAQGKMQTLQRGANAKTLSQVPGTGKDNLTLEALADMSDDDFNKHFDTLIRKT